MSILAFKAYNTTFNDFQLVTFVGGIVPTNGADYTPLAWNVTPFLKGSIAAVSWPQTYGLSVLSSGSSETPIWTAISSIDNLPLGIVVTLSYDRVTDNYKFGHPTPGGPPGTLTVNLDATIPVNPSNTVSLGVNIDGSPTGLLPPSFFQRGLSVTFAVTPTYSIAAAISLVSGQVIDQSAITGSLPLLFIGGWVQEATLLPNNTWKYGRPALLQAAAKPEISFSLSPLGLTLDISAHPAVEDVEKELGIWKGGVADEDRATHLYIPGASHFRGNRA